MRTRQLSLLVVFALLMGAQSIFAADVTIQANNDTVHGTVLRDPFTITTLTDNDTSSAGPVFLYAVSQPAYGNAEVRPGNVVVYAPSNRFTGQDTFAYAISSEPNGAGTISQANVTVRNPYFLYRGTYTSAIVGTHQVHEQSGYLTVTLDKQGKFTAKLYFAGLPYSFKAEFDANRRYTASIQRKPPLSDLRLDMQFHLEGSPGIKCDLINGAEVTSFTAPLNVWSSSNRPSLAGRYTMTLPAPDTRSTTPKGNGYGIISISNNGTVTFRGKTGDNRSYFSSSKLGLDNKIPFYTPLYAGAGSIFGDVVLTRSVNTDKVAVDASLIWTKLRKPKDKLFPKGFIRTVMAHGSNYIEPGPNTCILKVVTTENFNSNFTVAAGVLPKPRTERALLANRPDVGNYGVSFDNSKRLRASFKITPSNGVFRGTFFNVITRKQYKMSGVFVQGDNAAYGLWSSSTRSGNVFFQPDFLSGN